MTAPTEAVPTEQAETAVTANRHLPARPAWTCVLDGRNWPCPGARTHLLTAYAGDRVGLAVYLSTQLMTAAADLAAGDTMPPHLFNRFMALTEPDRDDIEMTEPHSAAGGRGRR